MHKQNKIINVGNGNAHNAREGHQLALLKPFNGESMIRIQEILQVDQHAMTKLHTSLIRPLLEYGSFAWAHVRRKR